MYNITNMYITGCHTKVHKDHFDKKEEFVAYCKGM